MCKMCDKGEVACSLSALCLKMWSCNGILLYIIMLHFFRQLVFPCSYLIRGTIPTSVLVLVENIFTPLFMNFLWCASCTHAVD